MLAFYIILYYIYINYPSNLSVPFPSCLRPPCSFLSWKSRQPEEQHLQPAHQNPRLRLCPSADGERLRRCLGTSRDPRRRCSRVGRSNEFASSFWRRSSGTWFSVTSISTSLMFSSAKAPSSSLILPSMLIISIRRFVNCSFVSLFWSGYQGCIFISFV